MMGQLIFHVILTTQLIVSHYEVDRAVRKSQLFEYITSVPFPSNGDMIYFHDDGVETKNNFYQYHVFPVDTCGKRVSSPIVPSFTIDTSVGQTILCEVDINTIYKSIIPQRIY